MLYRGLLYRGSTVSTSVSLHISLSRNLPYLKNQEVVCEFQCHGLQAKIEMQAVENNYENVLFAR